MVSNCRIQCARAIFGVGSGSACILSACLLDLLMFKKKLL